MSCEEGKRGRGEKMFFTGISVAIILAPHYRQPARPRRKQHDSGGRMHNVPEKSAIR